MLLGCLPLSGQQYHILLLKFYGIGRTCIEVSYRSISIKRMHICCVFYVREIAHTKNEIIHGTMVHISYEIAY